MANVVKEQNIKKLKLLFTVVDRSKAEFYLDVLGQFNVNAQWVVAGRGTAASEVINLLGLNHNKAVLISVITDDMTKRILNCLEDKFKTVKNGKGIAFTVPFSSAIGVNTYRFLSNNR